MRMLFNQLTLARLGLVVCLLCVTTLALLPITEIPGFMVWDKANHFIAFVVLTGLLYFSFEKIKIFTLIILPLFGYGFLLEVIQGLTEYRVFSMFDLLADAIGIMAGIVVCRLIRKYVY